MVESASRVECCATDFILSCPFRMLTVQEKTKLIKNGRSTPQIDLHSENRHGKRHFHMELYNKYLFLTASCKLNKLFCWPCLLFMNTRSVLGKKGFSDLNNLYTQMTIHISSEKHLHCVLELGSFVDTRVETADHQATLGIKRHNEKVERTKNILRRLIDTTVFLGKQEMSFFGNEDVSESSDNRGNFIESLLYLSSYDSLIETHLDSSSSNTFSFLSNSIQNDLVTSVTEVMLTQIKSQISQSPFVSITIDTFPDKNNRERLATILRYCSNDNVEERFVGFEDASGAKRTAEILSRHIFTILERFGCLEKLVAQTYNSGAILSSELHKGQHEVHQRCPLALLVPESDQTLNLALAQCVEGVRGCKTFFCHVKSLVNFFNASTKRSSLLAKMIDDNQNKNSTTENWQYTSLNVSVIFAHKDSIINTFEHIQKYTPHWDNDSLSFADVYIDKLEEFDFNFYLNIFSKIFTQVEILFNIVKGGTASRMSSLNNIKKFKMWLIEDFETSFDSLFSGSLKSSEPPRKKRCYEEEDKDHYRQTFEAIASSVLTQLNNRYEYLEKFKFLDLLDPGFYDSYSRLFPDPQFLSLQQGFPDAFDWTRLENELKAIYSSALFRKCDASDLYEFFRTSTNIISDSFSQAFRLCRLFLTIPSRDGSSSVLKRLRTYSRNTQNEHRFSELALIAVEKNLLLKLKRGPTFYNDVLKQLAEREERLDLEYK